MAASAPLSRTPFFFLFERSCSEDRVAAYIIREHGRGRALSEILDDQYVRARLSLRQQRRLLERPAVVHALANDALEEVRRLLASEVAGTEAEARGAVYQAPRLSTRNDSGG